MAPIHKRITVTRSIAINKLFMEADNLMILIHPSVPATNCPDFEKKLLSPLKEFF